MFPKTDSVYRFCIDQAWELLSNWMEDGQTFQGLPCSQLELPPVDTWQPHITHSWKLAFPSPRDRQVLQRALAPFRSQIMPFQDSNPALVERLLRQQELSSALARCVIILHQCLAAGKPPRARTVELLERQLSSISFTKPCWGCPNTGPGLLMRCCVAGAREAGLKNVWSAVAGRG